MVPGRPRTSALNLSPFKVIAQWDFLSYPESYPRQSRAAMGPLGIGWARMSMHRDIARSESNDIVRLHGRVRPVLTRCSH